MGERRTLIIIATTIAVMVGLVFVWSFSTTDRTLSASLTDITDQAAIRSHLEISRIGVATGENYMGHKIRVIGGTLRNVSDKPLRLVEVKMTFMDFDGKPVQESVEKAYEVTYKPLAPGDDHRFEINFENLPRNWNHRIPMVEAVRVAY